MTAEPCRLDSDCYSNKENPSVDELKNKCCAYMKIMKLDPTAKSHSRYIEGLKK